MNRIEGYCIIEKATGKRFGELYETVGGAKASWGHSMKREWYLPVNMRHLVGKKFDEQDEYILQPLVLLEGTE